MLYAWIGVAIILGPAVLYNGETGVAFHLLKSFTVSDISLKCFISLNSQQGKKFSSCRRKFLTSGFCLLQVWLGWICMEPS